MQQYTSSIFPKGARLEPITAKEVKLDTVYFEAAHVLICYFLVWWILWSHVSKVIKKSKDQKAKAAEVLAGHFTKSA